LGIRLIGIGFLLLVFLPTQQIHNFIIGWNNAIVTTIWFTLLALYLLVKSIEMAEAAKRSVILFVCALLSGILATYSMANGLLIWPIMLLVCTRFREWPRAIIVTLVGIIMITTYLWNFQRTGLLLDAARQPALLLQYLIAFLGNIITPSLGMAVLVGTLGILLVLYHFVRQGCHSDRDSPTVWFLLGVCLFCIGTAGLTSLGRFGFGAELGVQPTMSAAGALKLRYYSFVSLLWAALLVLGFIVFKLHSKMVSRNAWLCIDAAALIVAVSVCGSAYLLGPTTDWLMLNRHDRLERAATAIVAGAPDQVALQYIYPYSNIDIRPSVSYLASHRLSLFHSYVDYFLYQEAHAALHKPLIEGMKLDGKWCAGRIDEISKVADEGHSGATWNEVSGWTVDRELQRSVDGVLFADEEGGLAGIGRMSFARSVERTANLKNSGLIVHYDGYVEMLDGRSVVAYAFESDRSDLCRFDKKKVQ
jgi:hypothetical protein